MDKQLLPEHKRQAVQLLCEHLEADLRELQTAIDSALEAATHTENKAENKYDTRGLEASYLAGAQTERGADLRRAIGVLRAASVRDYLKDDAVGPLALVAVRSGDELSYYLLLPVAGGLSVTVAGVTIKSLTSKTVLGKALLGKNVGDEFAIETALGVHEYEVIGLV